MALVKVENGISLGCACFLQDVAEHASVNCGQRSVCTPLRHLFICARNVNMDEDASESRWRSITMDNSETSGPSGSSSSLNGINTTWSEGTGSLLMHHSESPNRFRESRCLLTRLWRSEGDVRAQVTLKQSSAALKHKPKERKMFSNLNE